MIVATESPPQEDLVDKLPGGNDLSENYVTQSAVRATENQSPTKKPNPLAAAFTPRGATFSDTLEDLYGFSIEYASADESSRFV